MNHIPYTYPMRTFTFHFMIVLCMPFTIHFPSSSFPNYLNYPLAYTLFHIFIFLPLIPFSYHTLVYAIEKSRSHKHIKSSMAVIKNIHNFVLFFLLLWSQSIHIERIPKISVVPEKIRKIKPRKKVPCFHFRRFPCRICVENYGVGDW